MSTVFFLKPKSSCLENCFFTSPATGYKTSYEGTPGNSRRSWGSLWGWGSGGFVHCPGRNAHFLLRLGSSGGVSSPQLWALHAAPTSPGTSCTSCFRVPHTNAQHQTTGPVSNRVVPFIRNRCPGIPSCRGKWLSRLLCSAWGTRSSTRTHAGLQCSWASSL